MSCDTAGCLSTSSFDWSHLMLCHINLSFATQTNQSIRAWHKFWPFYFGSRLFYSFSLLWGPRHLLVHKWKVWYCALMSTRKIKQAPSRWTWTMGKRWLKPRNVRQKKEKKKLHIQAIFLSCDSNWAKASSMISMWQCRRQKHHIPELLCSTRRTACSGQAGWSEFLQLLIKWKVIFRCSWLEGAAAVCVAAAEVLAVINFMKLELQIASCTPDSCLLWISRLRAST